MKVPKKDPDSTPLERAARPLLLLALARNMKKTGGSEADLDAVPLIAEALEGLAEVERDTALSHSRVASAELETVEARHATKRHAFRSQQMEQLANTDPLTDMPNRRAFMARWDEELVRSAEENYPIGLLLLDADRFKTVNDTEGHEMGDAVLRAIGASLLTVVGPHDIVARLGGDEFALLTTRTGSDDLQALAGKIGGQFQIIATELGVDTTLSIGMVSSEDCPRERMLADADRALYRSKEAGGNVFRTVARDGVAPAPTPRVRKNRARGAGGRSHASA